MAHFYHLPMFALGGCSDSKVVDQQAALEASLTLLHTALGGGHLVHDMGYLESGLTSSLAQLAICNEIVDWVKAAMQPIEVSDETLALDLIDEIGPDGQLLESDHTLRHYRDRWYPDLIERSIFDEWSAAGSKTLGQRAAEKVDEILASHTPEPLAPEVAAAVHAVVERAERAHANSTTSK
jgi:trimethylamine--corrinoid protein Co-methyltransferase